MKYVHIPVEFTAFLGDPNDKSRPPAYHIGVATYIDNEDGSRLEEVSSKRRTLTPAQCLEAGISVPDVAAQFDTAAAASADLSLSRAEVLQEKLNEYAGALESAVGVRMETEARLLRATEVIQTLLTERVQMEARIKQLEEALAAKEAAQQEGVV